MAGIAPSNLPTRIISIVSLEVICRSKTRNLAGCSEVHIDHRS